MAAVCVAPVSGPGRWSGLQWNPDQPLLGPHICVLHQQVVLHQGQLVPVRILTVVAPPGMAATRPSTWCVWAPQNRL